jgi:hypothetical protein
MFISADPTTNAFATQVTVSGIIVALMQWLKNSKWFPWLTAESSKVNSFVAAAAAAAGAIGVHLAWNHGAIPGTYMIEVSGLTLMGVLGGIWAWLKMFVYQQIIFRATVKPAPLATDAGAAKVQLQGIAGAK